MTESLAITPTLQGLRAEGGLYHGFVAPNWAQGRAGYGGVVTALAFEAMRRELGTGSPLRSLTVAFIGPAVGDLTIGVERLRVGRTAAFLQATVRAGEDVVATVGACFGPDRDSVVSLPAAPGPEVPPPDACIPLPDGPPVPTFLKNLDVRIARGVPFMGRQDPEILWWARHRDEAAWGTESGFVALLDTLPPAAATQLKGASPLSSLTWMVDFPSTGVDTTDGWYLLRSVSDYAGGGFSGQAMQAWNRDGKLVALHRQSIAIFG